MATFLTKEAPADVKTGETMLIQLSSEMANAATEWKKAKEDVEAKYTLLHLSLIHI